MKTTYFFLLGSLLLLCGVPECAVAAPTSVISISGEVLQPLLLTLEDLSSYQSVQVRRNEVVSDGAFRGVFTYQGVPLKTLLSLARVAKGDTGFSQSTDLAIRVTGRDGRQVALSWGEVFCQNPSSVVVAAAASPVLPQRGCIDCHAAEEAKTILEPYERKPVLPMLVMSDDRYADRDLEDISRIEVIDLRPRMQTKTLEQLYAPSFEITGAVAKPMTIKKLSAFTRTEIPVRHGECRGYHGMLRFSGVALKDIVAGAGIHPDSNTMFLVSAPDGYRSLVSYGELFLSNHGDGILIADRLNGKPLDNDGKYYLICAEDLVFDRRVDAVSRIEVISLREPPQLCVIGIGCGDTRMITLEALSGMAKAGAFICPPDIARRFAHYLGGKPVLFDMYDFTPPALKKQNPDLSPEDLQNLLKEKQEQAAGTIKKIMSEGRNVALLDYGDPAIFTGNVWVRDFFEEKDLKIITGISSFNAASALLNKKFDGNRSIVLTTPWDITANPALLQAAAARGDAVVLFFPLTNLSMLMPLLQDCYPPATPAFIVYKAGYEGGEEVVETTIERLQTTVDEHEEKMLALLYIGAPVKKDG